MQGDTENEELFETGFDGARQISYQFVDIPEPVASLFDKQITQISCGEEHSAAVSSKLFVFCCFAVLAFGFGWVEQRVRANRCIQHLLGEGTLYCWGSGRDGKLGNGSSEDEHFPFPVESLSSVRAAKVSCGAHQTVRSHTSHICFFLPRPRFVSSRLTNLVLVSHRKFVVTHNPSFSDSK